MSAVQVAQELLAGHNIRQPERHLAILQITNWSTIKTWLKPRVDDQLLIILLTFPFNWDSNIFYVAQFLQHYGIYLGVADQDKLQVLLERLEWYRHAILSQELGITRNLSAKQMSDRDWFLHTGRIYKRNASKRKDWDYFYGKVILAKKEKAETSMVARENFLYFLSLVRVYAKELKE